jgi:type II secretory pathway component PulF
MQSIDKSRFGVREKIFFFKELYYLLSGGVSIIDALEVIAHSSDDYALKDIAYTIKSYIKAGKNLSYAMNRLPDYFDESDYNIVKIGEKSGDLPDVLHALSEEYAYLTDVKNKYISALMYPIILVVISVAAVLSLFLLVPWMTTLLRDISVFLQDERQMIAWIL